jgi:branched-chain amino acid transport system substrate-binding protein
MVVGHLYSTPTKSALPNYLNADPPIPVILPFESSPDLLPPRIPEDIYYPVFRLSPTDDKQAEKAADFVANHGAKAVWVVEDALNNVYSNYLAREFISQVHRLKSSKVLLWTTHQEIPSADAVKALGIDWVFFAGHWSNALILIRQMNAIWEGQRQKPPILLSDWGADQALIDQGSTDVERVYLTHPMRASVFNEAGYAFWGDLAYRLLKQLIQDADGRFNELAREKGGPGYYLRWVANFHNVADARNALHALMEEAVTLERTFDLDEQRYTFRRDGTGIETPFHVWQVQKVNGENKFMDIEN